MSHLFLFINEGHQAEINTVECDRCTLWTCECAPSNTQMELCMSTHTNTLYHTHPYPSPSALLCTSYNSLSGFETWSVGCLVTAAWFSGYWSYPFPPHRPPPSFYSVSQWTLFSSLQSQGFKRQEDACRGETHTLLIPGPGQSCLKVNRENVEKFVASFLFAANKLLRLHSLTVISVTYSFLCAKYWKK